MENTNIPLDIIDTDTYRNHQGARSQVVLSDDRIMHEALSICERYDEDDVCTQTEYDYYIREQYRRQSVSGVYVCSDYHKKIDKHYYRVNVSIIGVQDDILLTLSNRKKALHIYKLISEWIFDK